MEIWRRTETKMSYKIHPRFWKTHIWIVINYKLHYTFNNIFNSGWKKMLFGTDMIVALPCTARSQTSLGLTPLMLFIPHNTVKWKTHVRTTNKYYIFHTAPTCFGAIILQSSGKWHQAPFKTYRNKTGPSKPKLTGTYFFVWYQLPEDVI